MQQHEWAQRVSCWEKQVRQRRRNIIWHPLYVESKKKSYKNRKRLTSFDNKFMAVVGRIREEIVREFEMSMYTLLYFKWITRTYCKAQWTAQCSVTAWMGRRFWGKNGYMYMYGWVPSLFTCYHNIVMYIVIAYTPMQNKKLKKIPVS